MARVDQLTKLMSFLIAGYFALTAAEAFTFAFVW